VTISSLPMPELSEAPPAGPPSGRAALLDRALKVAGGVLAVLMAVLTAILELQLSGLRVAGALVGVSVLVAGLANFGISWFAQRTTDTRWAVAPPALVWLGIMLIASGETTEGDFLLTGWVGLATMAAGAAGFTVAGIRMILAPTR
jgi:hypothetical protein